MGDRNTLATPTYEPPKDCSQFEIEKFRVYVSRQTGKVLANYDDLHKFSVREQNSFWMYIWKYLDIIASVHPQKAISVDARVNDIPTFFPEARLNYAENALRWSADRAAIISIAERSFPRTDTITWPVLRERVSATATALDACGIRLNDVVAFLGANTPTAVILLLAAASRGASFCSLAGDMGEQAALDRLTQIKPKILFADNGYQYNGKLHDQVGRQCRIASRLSLEHGLQHCIGVENVNHGLVSHFPDDGCWMSMSQFLSLAPDCQADLHFVQVPFNHPMMILFSSGTTGTPKGMIHSHGGTLVNLKKEHVLHENMLPIDVYYHYTNVGWTMWNIFLGGMLSGATIVLYDGSPFYPTATANFDHILSIGTTVFGGSPRYYTELKDRAFRLRNCGSRNRLRLLASTGAVLSASVWTWLAAEFNRLPIISFSGGTEICGSFVHGTVVNRQYAGEITLKALGIDADIFDADGESCAPGVPGDLVIKKPFPNAATRFWDDPDGKRYQMSYFDRFPGVWTQGDFARINARTGGIIMLGRSDGVLNPSGVRFGSAEIYKVLESMMELKDAICVGQRLHSLDEQVLLFLEMKPGHLLDPALLQRIRSAIAQSLSPRHVPKHILEVEKIPYNVNGKKLEVLVKSIVSGGKITAKVRSTLAHPNDLDVFEQFVGLRDSSFSGKAKL